MKRKMIVLILVLLLCASLCACGSYRANDSMTDREMNRDQTDMVPDGKDGYVDDDTGSGGVINGELAIPSPNVSHTP